MKRGQIMYQACKSQDIFAAEAPALILDLEIIENG